MSRSNKFPSDLEVEALRIATRAGYEPVIKMAREINEARKAAKDFEGSKGDPPFDQLGAIAAKTIILLGEKQKVERTFSKAMRDRRRIMGSQIDIDGERLSREIVNEVHAEVRPILNDMDAAATARDDEADKKAEEEIEKFVAFLDVNPANTPAELPDREKHVCFLAQLNEVMDDPAAALPTREARESWYWQMKFLWMADNIASSEESLSIGDLMRGGTSGRGRRFYSKAIKVMLTGIGEAQPEHFGDEVLFDLTHNARVDYIVHRHKLVEKIKAKAEGKEECGSCGGIHES